ncbi:diguanylate cyclase [Actinoplanes sp. NPDC023801]|uniref:diguanylate cyclase n=1 Tax=Actinoplanes sp. NPDC023801 TaxID=3154595 RepID=UPI0033E64A33
MSVVAPAPVADAVARLCPAGFTVLGELGSGGQAVVYRIGRGDEQYAVKLFHPESEPEPFLAALRREAARLARAVHPGLPRVHDVGVVDDRPYLVMDLVEGRPLTDALRAGPMPAEALLDLAVGLAGALRAAHGAGLMHGDIKPDSVLLAGDGRVHLTDFSLGSRMRCSAPGDRMAGTATYTAPEQSGMVHRPVDLRADLYSFGVVLFECATGRPPYEAADLGELLRLHAVAPVPDPRQAAPHLSPALADVIVGLLAKDPDDRLRNADELHARLSRIAGVPPCDPATGVPGAAADTPLAGRDAELAELGERWNRAVQGHGGIVVISGAPGSGKSRLARELTGRLPDRHPVLRGGGSRIETQPLAPLRAAVDDYVRQLIGGAGHVTASAALQDLRLALHDTDGIVLALSGSLAQISEAAPPEGVLDEERWTAAVADFLLLLARRAGGMVLHLDDVQWLDRSTVRVMEQLAGSIGEVPLLVLLTARDDAASAPAVHAFGERLGDGFATVVLAPLDSAAVAELVVTLNGGSAVSLELATKLTARSHGNPYLLYEYVRAIIDAGLVTVRWGEWHVETAGLDVLDLPGDVAELVHQRIDTLDARGRHLLGTAAVSGYRFDAALLATVSELPPGVVDGVLAEAARHALVERHADGTYGFLHERIRQVLADDLDDVTRRALHDRIADVRGAHPDADPQAVYATARHRMNGTPGYDPAGTFAACHAAGALALADHAPDTAVTFLEHAMAVAREAGSTAGPGCEELLATAYHQATRLEDAAGALHEALTRTTDPIRRAKLWYRLSAVHTSAWNTAEQIRAGEAALTELGADLPRSGPARVLSTMWLLLVTVLIRVTGIGRGTATGRKRERYLLLCSIYDNLGGAYTRELQPRRSVIYALRAPYLAVRAGRSPESVLTLSSIALLLEFSRLPSLAAPLAAVCRRQAEGLGDRQLAARVAWSRAVARHGGGSDNGESVEQVLADHDRWLDFGLALDAYAVLSWDWLLRGDMAAAEEGLGRARRRATASGQGNRSAVVAADACLLALRGRAGEAARHLAAIEGDDIPLHQWVDLLIGKLQTAVERQDFGDDFDSAMSGFDAIGLRPRDLLPAQHTLYCLRAYAELERCHLSTGEHREARLAAARAAVTTLGQVAYRPILRAHHRVGAAALSVMAGRPEKGLKQLAAAAPVLHAVDAPLVEFEAARVAAYALLALGRPEHARRRAGYALSLAYRQGWPHRAQRLIAEFGLEAPAGPEQPGGRVHVDREAQRWAALQQVSLAASRVLDPAQLARIALDETIRILGAERALLLLEEDSATDLGGHVGRDAHGRDLVEVSGYSTTVVEQVRTARTARVVTGTEQGEVLSTPSMVEFGLRSILAAPVLLDDRLLGVVYLDSRLAKGVFSGGDVDVLTAITHQIAISLETARTAQLEVAVAAAHRQRDLAEMLREAMGWFAATLEPDEVLDRLITSALRTGRTGRACLVLEAPGEPRTLTVRYRDASGAHQARITDMPAGIAGLAYADEPFLTAECTTVPSLLRIAGAEPGGDAAASDGWRLVPLTARGTRLGVLLLGGPATEPGEAEVIAALAGQAMAAYDNALLFAEVHRLATVDALTGVANRRHFFDEARRMLARDRGPGGRLAAMMVDIDHFKRINDTYGHQVGDEVIREVVARLRAACRPADLVARYGGEEFIVLLPDAGDRGPEVAERIRAEVARTPVGTAAGPVHVTLSIGLSYLAGQDELDDLLARADSHLYEAKAAGRDRVVLDRPGPSRPVMAVRG